MEGTDDTEDLSYTGTDCEVTFCQQRQNEKCGVT